MLPSTSFFRNTGSPKTTRIKSEFIDVGGDAFHALAVAFMDNLKRGAHLSDYAASTILQRFFTYFPDYKITQAYLSTTDRMRLLVNNTRKSEIVECLAYVLRQLTVDAILANPLAYPETFSGLSKQTLQDYLRQIDTTLPYSALAAIAETLHINLILSFKEPGKELRKRQIHQGSGAEVPFEVTLQVQGDRYFPKVSTKTDFIYVGQLAIKAPAPIASCSVDTLSNELELIAQQDAALLSKAEEYRKILMNMVADRELTKDLLVDLYIKFLPSQSSAPRFALIEQANKVLVNEAVGSLEQQNLVSLVHSLAQELSAGTIDVDNFFEQIESPRLRSRLAG